MVNITGQLMMSCDLNSIRNAQLNNCVVVALCEDQNFIRSINAKSGSVLLPPYECMCAERDNSVDAFYQLYCEYLNQYEANSFIAALLQALKLGNNIVFYTTQEILENFEFPRALCLYFQSFGIIIGNEQQPAMYQPNQNTEAALCDILYNHNYMEVNELMMSCPIELPLSEACIYKLQQELNPYVPVADFEHFATYFNNMKNETQMNKQFLMEGISFGE